MSSTFRKVWVTVLCICLVNSTNPSMAFAQSSTNKFDFKKMPQFVLMAFDGSYENRFWEESRSFAREMSAKGKPVKFTYFVSGVYWADGLNFSDIYHAPHVTEEENEKLKAQYEQSSEERKKSIRNKYYSNIGFGDSKEDIEKRIQEINAAFSEGHEVASHANSHKAGGIMPGMKGKAEEYTGDSKRSFQEQVGFDWNQQEWGYEFSKFTELLFGVFDRYKFDAVKSYSFKLSDVVGFRAPLLSYNWEMYETMKQHNFKYDTSGTALLGYWPKKGLKRHQNSNLAQSDLSYSQRRQIEQNAIWDFPLTYLPLNRNETGADIYKSGIPSMDFNFCNSYMEWTRPDPKNPNRMITTRCPGTDTIKALKLARGNPNGPAFDREVHDKNYYLMLSKYMAYFKTHYNGNRAPIHIGHHFSQWADGAYWDAMKMFANQVCGLPDVKCVTYTELMNYMEQLSKENPSLLAMLQNSQKPLDYWYTYFKYLDAIEKNFDPNGSLIAAKAKVYVDPKISFNRGEFALQTSLSRRATLLGYKSVLAVNGVPVKNSKISIEEVRKQFESEDAEVAATVVDGRGRVLAQATLKVRNLGTQDESVDLLTMEERSRLGDLPEAHEGH